MNKKYLIKKIEKNVQMYWEKNNSFKVFKNIKKKKYYILSMIPYPSGNLHIGHVRNYTIGDVISRYQRMLGKNVMQPIGWDAFGLPAEIAAIKKKILPSIWTYKNIKKMKNQLKSLGFSYDWNRELITCKPNFYKWEQWFITKLYKKKLIYKKKSLVNWCKIDKTVLANEQVINGNCWRCDNKIIKKKMSQWFLKITLYAKELLENLKYLNNWPYKVKEMQKNWIGESKNFIFFFYILNKKNKIIINTNRINILINFKYIFISLNNFISIEESKKNDKIKKFINKYKKKKFNKIKKSIFSNLYAINPITKKNIPIWIVNFNLNDNINNFTMCLMIKNKNNLKLIKNNDTLINILLLKKNKIKFNKIILFSPFNFKETNYINKYKKIIKKVIKLNLCKKKIFFNIFDWNISRQRYWGTPIPIAKIIKNNKIVSIPNNKLPIILPNKISFNNIINFFKKNKWPKILINNNYAEIETSTLDTFIESSWYYIRYTSPKYNKNIIKFDSMNYWLPIDQYIGGIEHATMHLLYFRFFHKLLRDFGLVNSNEPVKNLICQGMVLFDAFYYLNKNNEKIWVSKNEININFNKYKKIKNIKDNYGNTIKYAGMLKMSKSKNNGINPKIIIKKYGADIIRFFVMFSSPIEIELEWKESQLIGVKRFLNNIWEIFIKHINNKLIKPLKILKLNYKQKKIIYLLHKLIYEVTLNIKKKCFNNAISKLMKYTNKIKFFNKIKTIDHSIFHECLLTLIRLFYPFIPHICFKLWKELFENNDIDFVSWPIFSKNILLNKKKKIIIQINSKFFKNIIIKKKIKKEKLLNIIIKKYLFNKKNILNKIIKIIYINNKIFNIILKF